MCRIITASGQDITLKSLYWRFAQKEIVTAEFAHLSFSFPCGSFV